MHGIHHRLLRLTWVVEPKGVRPSVLVVRTLLSNIGANAYVRVLNCGSAIPTLSAGETISIAEPIDRGDGSSIDVPDCACKDNCAQNKHLQTSTQLTQKNITMSG